MEDEESQTRKDIPSGQARVQMLPAHPVILLYFASILGGGDLCISTSWVCVCVAQRYICAPCMQNLQGVQKRASDPPGIGVTDG